MSGITETILDEIRSSEINHLASSMHYYSEDWSDYFEVYLDNGELISSWSGQCGENISENGKLIATVEMQWPYDGRFSYDVIQH